MNHDTAPERENEHDRLVEAVGAAAALLTQEEKPARALHQALQLIAEPARASFVCVYRATGPASGELRLRPRYSHAANDRHLQAASDMLESSPEQWRQELEAGRAVTTTLAAGRHRDRAANERPDNVALELQPIPVDSALWGALVAGFELGESTAPRAAPRDATAWRGMALVLGAALQREKQRLAADREYRNVFESTGEMVFSHDLDGRFRWMNQAGLELLGYERDELFQLRVEEIVAPEYIDLAREMSVRKLAGGISATTYELEMLTRRGHRLSVEISSSVVYEEGRPVGIQGLARDISERKRLENQLRQSQKMDAVGRLAGGIVHDLNNIITVIQGCSELMRTSISEQSPLHEDIGQIERACGRATDLTRQLLTFSRQQLMVPRLIDLNERVRSMEEMLRRVIGEDIDLVTSLAQDLAPVRVDPNQMEQVILNLAVNARDAMPDGGSLRLTTDTAKGVVSAFQSVPQGEYVELLVQDTGCGMDASTLARAFEPFFTTKEEGKGTGLGLSTVYGIVKQSGGHILCESRPGEGTTTRVCLPRADAALLEPDEDTGTAIATSGQPPELSVMVAEDDPAVRRLTTRVLRDHGYDVVEAVDGRDALAKLERAAGAIELLITDVVMPHLSGAQLAHEARTRFPSIELLFISGYSKLRTGEPARELPRARYLSKPFSPNALLAAVEEIQRHHPDGG
jgi:PAS domain S-box-containing protein